MRSRRSGPRRCRVKDDPPGSRESGCAERRTSWNTSGVIDEPDLSGIAARNRTAWDEQAAEYQATHGGQLAASGGAAWGVWQIPESELGILGDVGSRDVLEL